MFSMNNVSLKLLFLLVGVDTLYFSLLSQQLMSMRQAMLVITFHAYNTSDQITCCGERIEIDSEDSNSKEQSAPTFKSNFRTNSYRSNN